MIIDQLDPQMYLAPSLCLRSPGDVLTQDYLCAKGLSAQQLSRRSRIPVRHIAAIVKGRRPVTPQNALRLAVALNTSALYWMLLQAHHDLEHALHPKGDQVREYGQR